jgi:hypothetical protein
MRKNERERESERGRKNEREREKDRKYTTMGDRIYRVKREREK